MKVLLHCRHGFMFAAYQRVECKTTGEDGEYGNYYFFAESLQIQWNRALEVGDSPMFREGCNVFVMGGESYTLADFANSVEEIMGIPISFQDKDGEIENVD